MSLFQNSVLNKYLKGLESEKVNEAYEKFKSHFHNPTIQENIRNSKEEQYQGEFLIDLFVNVFGYIKNPTPDFNLTTELKNIKGSKKTDGAILKGEKALAVIELKGTNTTDLSKVETQAFGYKNNQPGCNYVITSNFEKLRFYIDNAVDFEEFNLFQLTKERFEILWLCLSSEYLLKDIPKKIKEESLTQEENITKKLYKDYASFRNEIFDAIQNENPEYDKLTLFKKTQKLLDRFLFIFFAEDRLLLPPNSIRSIVNQWTDLKDKYDEYFPLYDRFKKYFGYMNTGHKGHKHDIFSYNGGLFAPDEILDNIKINDDLLYEHTLKLSNYDFESEVSVNILGHIFEHSLNDIEEIQNEIEGIVSDRGKTKRIKDGVFYTPKYITKYIVDNSIGHLCKEKKNKLDINDENYQPAKQRSRKKLDNLQTYRDWLLKITICDPACGSGAFLNQALEFLISEHRYIDELSAKYNKDTLLLSEVENSILENNLFGVDINDESVEIAKLSLWLRTAQKGRKLTSLNNNIKCGNSLIDDPLFAGEKAFNWENEFPNVFKNGGFDIVIGNPPYVRHELITDIKIQLEKNYTVYQSIADLYVYFIEKGIKLLNTKGILGFITPNKFIQSTYGKNLRKFIGINTQILKMIDFGELPVFSDAATFPFISIISKNKAKTNTEFLKVKSLESLDLETNFQQNKIEIDSKIFKKDNWQLISKNEQLLFDKILNSGIKLNEYLDVTFYRGILTGFNEAFIIDNEKRLELIKNDSNSNEIIKPFVDGDDVRRYHLRSKGKFLIFTRRGIDIDKYPAIKEYLHQYYERLKPKSSSNDKIGRKKGDYKWYEIQDSISYFDEFEKTKIIYPEIAKESRFTIDDSKTYLNKTIFLIPSDDKYLLALLNSKVIWFYLMNVCTALGNPKEGGRLNLQKVYLEKTPIINSDNKNNLIEKASNQLSSNKSFQSLSNTFLDLITSKFEFIKLSKKLQNWFKLEFGIFLKELKKQKILLSLNEEAEWMQYFNEQKEKAQNLISEIEKTDSEIDQMVYELYGLSDDEIKIVEEATA